MAKEMISSFSRKIVPKRGFALGVACIPNGLAIDRATALGANIMSNNDEVKQLLVAFSGTL